MANTKMFVHYSGTVADFKKLSNIADYDNKIVFIKGGANGQGAAIYTHGEYYTSAYEIEKLVSNLKAISGVMVNSDRNTLKVATTHDGVLNFCADGETVAVTMDGPGITISVSEAFRKRVTDLEASLGNPVTNEQGKADGTAYERIAKLASDIAALGGDAGSIAGQIAAAVNALKGTLDTDDAATLEDINDELNAIDTKWADYVTNASLAAIEGSDNAGDKVKVTVASKGGKVTEVTVDESGLTGALNLKANAADVYTKGEAETMAQGKVNALANNAVKANTDAIAVLNGNDSADGSVAKQIKDAINTFATNVSNDNTINTLKELIDYVAGVDGSKDLASAIAQIEKNKGKIATLNGDDKTAGSVAKAVADEAALRESADTAINGRIDALAAVVGAPESDTEATGIFKVIEENEKTTASALTDLDTRLQEVESKKDSIESALQASDITTGSANGTISVKGTDVKVKGLGSAAYTEASAYATAAQGAKADTAYQKPEAGIPLTDLASSVYTQEEVNDMWAWAEL